MRSLAAGLGLLALLYNAEASACTYDKLYDLDRIVNVDTSRKQVELNLVVNEHTAQGAFFKQYQSEVLAAVRKIYRRDLNLDLVITSRAPRSITVDDYATYSCWIEKVDPGKTASMLDGGAAAPYSHEGTVVIREELYDLAEQGNDARIVWILSNAIAHELDHLLGGWHTTLTDRDAQRDREGDRYNIMIPVENNTTKCAARFFSPSEKRRVHSFLSGGQAYEAWVQAGDLMTYESRVKEAIESRSCK